MRRVRQLSIVMGFVVKFSKIWFYCRNALLSSITTPSSRFKGSYQTLSIQNNLQATNLKADSQKSDFTSPLKWIVDYWISLHSNFFNCFLLFTCNHLALIVRYCFTGQSNFTLRINLIFCADCFPNEMNTKTSLNNSQTLGSTQYRERKFAKNSVWTMIIKYT